MARLYLVVAALLFLVTQAFAQEPIRPVKVIAIAAEPSGVNRQFFGKIVARQTVDLAFQVGGQIVEFPVVEGSLVETGGLIARLDLEPFELSLGRARLEKEQADRNLDRKKTLGAETVAQATIEDAETAASLAAIGVRNAEYQLEHATLLAPFDTLVAARNVANFSTIAAGTPVARLHDMSELRVEIDVPEVLFRQAREEVDVEVYAVVAGSTTRYPLEIREFNAETSAVGQTYTLTLAMTPPKDQQLLPGASVTVVARQLNTGTLFHIPSTAIVIDPDQSTHVMVFEPSGGQEGTVRKQAVELSTDENGRFVLMSGLDQGTEIVAAGVSGLSDGQTVRRFAGFTN